MAILMEVAADRGHPRHIEIEISGEVASFAKIAEEKTTKAVINVQPNTVCERKLTKLLHWVDDAVCKGRGGRVDRHCVGRDGRSGDRGFELAAGGADRKLCKCHIKIVASLGQRRVGLSSPRTNISTHASAHAKRADILSYIV